MLVHGNNLEQKEKHKTKYQDKDSRQYLREIRDRYDTWKTRNQELVGPGSEENENDTHTILQRVELLNSYKDFIDQQHYAEKFDSRSNLHSSVLEEFMYYLFRDVVADFSEHALIGKSHTFKDIFFKPDSYSDMLDAPNALIETKDHDFAIGTKIISNMTCRGTENNEKHTLDIPAVAIECKTYLDKTMLQDASTAAEQLKHRNPNAMYIVVAEWLKLTDSVNLRKFKIDQIYVLRKQKNTDREFRYRSDYMKNPVYADVVEHLFRTVRTFLTADWEGGISFGLKRGFLI
ncbi:MAG: Bpu10I family restriction endonuclease [Candidatus Electrothrix sp. AS4_5]|nr:Bpu10I family restriction endonuclease [Candidatus Electrothrix gigas]